MKLKIEQHRNSSNSYKMIECALLPALAGIGERTGVKQKEVKHEKIIFSKFPMLIIHIFGAFLSTSTYPHLQQQRI